MAANSTNTTESTGAVESAETASASESANTAESAVAAESANTSESAGAAESTSKTKSSASSSFRKSATDSASQPESLRDYLQVTSPRLWMLLTVVTVLLVGIIIFSCTTTMESTMDLTVKVKTYADGEERQPNIPDGDYFSVSSILDLSMKDTVEPGMVLRLAGEEGKLVYMYSTPENKLGLAFEMDNGPSGLEDGDYEATLVLESVSPISYLLN